MRRVVEILNLVEVLGDEVKGIFQDEEIENTIKLDNQSSRVKNQWPRVPGGGNIKMWGMKIF